MAVLSSSAALLALSLSLPPGADEIVEIDSHVTQILDVHLGLLVGLLNVLRFWNILVYIRIALPNCAQFPLLQSCMMSVLIRLFTA